MLTMAPPPLATIGSNASWQSRNGPLRLTSIDPSEVVGRLVLGRADHRDAGVVDQHVEPPAARLDRRRRPAARSPRRTATSVATGARCGRRARRRARRAARRPRAATTTVAPAACSTRANRRPRPDRRAGDDGRDLPVEAEQREGIEGGGGRRRRSTWPGAYEAASDGCEERRSAPPHGRCWRRHEGPHRVRVGHAHVGERGRVVRRPGRRARGPAVRFAVAVRAAHRRCARPARRAGFAAGRTQKLKLGTGVLVLPGRNPVVLAKEMASLDRLSTALPACVRASARPTPVEHQAFGVDRKDRAALVRRGAGPDAAAVDRGSVRPPGRPVPHRGRRACGPSRSQQPIDVWLGGQAPSELRRVRRLGATAWLPVVGCTVDDVAQGREADHGGHRAGTAAPGRPRSTWGASSPTRTAVPRPGAGHARRLAPRPTSDPTDGDPDRPRCAAPRLDRAHRQSARRSSCRAARGRPTTGRHRAAAITDAGDLQSSGLGEAGGDLGEVGVEGRAPLCRHLAEADHDHVAGREADDPLALEPVGAERRLVEVPGPPLGAVDRSSSSHDRAGAATSRSSPPGRSAGRPSARRGERAGRTGTSPAAWRTRTTSR